MHCAIYRSANHFETYLYVRDKDRFEDVPESLLKRLGRLKFVMELELTPARRLAQADAVHVMRLLQEQGYFLQIPPPHPSERSP